MLAPCIHARQHGETSSQPDDLAAAEHRRAPAAPPPVLTPPDSDEDHLEEASPDANKKKFSELRTMPGPHMAIAALNHNNEDNKAIEILEKHVATCKLETRQFDTLSDDVRGCLFWRISSHGACCSLSSRACGDHKRSGPQQARSTTKTFSFTIPK